VLLSSPARASDRCPAFKRERRRVASGSTVSGTTATLEGTVPLTGSSDCAQTWIVQGPVYCGDAGNDDGEVFKYPAGGSAIAVFRGNFDLPLGVVAAKK
jgi:hypothetical protein